MYDYRLDDAGISSTEDDDEDDEESKQVATALPAQEGGRVKPPGLWDLPPRDSGHLEKATLTASRSEAVGW